MSVSVSNTVRSVGISLRDIFPNATFINADQIMVRSLCTDPAECKPGDLFVALCEHDFDSHESIDLAVRRGAKAILTERLIPDDIAQCMVSDTRVACGKVAHALAGNPCQKMTTIAVGGTDGKTTTAHLIHSILNAAGRTAGLRSSITDDADVNDSEIDSTRTATGVELAVSMATLASRDHDFAVVETGSPEIAVQQFSGMELDVAVLTNLRGNHFGIHHTMANYRRTQLRLLDYLKPTGVAILNADDPGLFFALQEIKQPTLTVGIKQEADVTAKIIESDLYETIFVITAGDESITVRSQLPGTHHVYNCLVATATALLQGIPLTMIAAGLESIHELPGRMNLVRCGQGFTVMVDQASSPYRLGIALNTLKKQTKGRVICVFSTPGGVDPSIAAQFGTIAERNCAIPVITRPTANGPKQVAEAVDYEPVHQVLDGFNRPSSARIMTDRIAATEWALSQAKPGDAVLIAGQGANPIAALSEGRWHLTDKEVCQSWLYGDSTPGQSVSIAPPTATIFNINDYRPC